MVFFTGPPTLFKPMITPMLSNENKKNTQPKRRFYLCFAFLLIERYRCIKTDSWRCSICAGRFSRSIKNGNRNAQLVMGKSIRFLIMLSLGEDHTRFAENTSNSILPRLPQMKQGNRGLLHRPKGNVYLGVCEAAP